MADNIRIANLAASFDVLRETNLDSSLKRGLTQDGLFDSFQPQIAQLLELEYKLAEGAKLASPTSVDVLKKSIDEVIQNLHVTQNMNTAEFVQNKNARANSLQSALSQVLDAATPVLVWWSFGAADEINRASRTEARRSVEIIQAQLGNELQNLRQQAERQADQHHQAITALQDKATQLESAARTSVKEISIEASQLNFATLRKRFRVGAYISGGAGFATVGYLACYLYYLQNATHLFPTPEETISNAIVRLAFVTAVGAVVAILFKIFRGNLNLYYHAIHREHLASIAKTFVNAGENAEQRGMIFGKIVDAVTAFGNPGLVGGSDDGPTLKIVSDLVPKLFDRGQQIAGHH